MSSGIDVITKFGRFTLDKIPKISEWVGKIGGGCAILLTLLLMLYEIILRYGFNMPTRFNIEAATFCQVLVVAFAGAYVLKEEGHVSIGLITEKVNDKVRNWLMFSGSIISLVYCIYLSIQMWILASWSLKVNSFTENIGMPLAPIQFILFAGLVLLDLQFIVRIYHYYKLAVTSEVSGEDKAQIESGI